MISFFQWRLGISITIKNTSMKKTSSAGNIFVLGLYGLLECITIVGNKLNLPVKLIG